VAASEKVPTSAPATEWARLTDDLVHAIERASALLHASHWVLLDGLVALGVAAEGARAWPLVESAAARALDSLTSVAAAAPAPAPGDPSIFHAGAPSPGPLYAVLAARRARVAWTQRGAASAARFLSASLLPSLRTLLGPDHSALRAVHASAALDG
jgi:hypothetical protein